MAVRSEFMNTSNPEAWFEILEKLRGQLRAVSRDKPEDFQRDVLRIVQSAGAFEDAQARDDGAVWARVIDGPVIALPFRLHGAPPEPSPAQPAALSGELPTQTASLLTRREKTEGNRGQEFQFHGGLPAGKNAVVFCTTDVLADTAFAFELQQWLRGCAYNVTGDPTRPMRPMGLQSLRSLGEISVLYWSCHAWYYYLNLSSKYHWAVAVQVRRMDGSDSSDSESKRALADDVEGPPKSFIPRIYLSHYPDPDPAKNAWYYHITSQFVRHYFRFSANSLVFIDGCGTAAGLGTSADFINAFHEKQASVYLGWTGEIDDDYARSVAKFIFGGLLGTELGDLIGKESRQPPRRPFDLDAMLSVLREHNKDEYKGVKLVTNRGPGNFGGLLPNIFGMTVAPIGKELSIVGLVGDDKARAKATINGKRLREKKEAHEDPSLLGLRLTCGLSECRGGGEVVLDVDGRQSNWRWLTEWTGHIKYTREEIGEPPFSGKRTYTIEFDFLLPADVQDHRNSPDADPEPHDQRERSVVEVLNYRFHAEGHVEQGGASPKQGKRIFNYSTQHADLNRVATVGFSLEPAKKQLLLYVLPAEFARSDAVKEESWSENADGSKYPAAPRLLSSIAFFPNDISDFIVIPLDKKLSSSDSHAKTTPRGSTDAIPISNTWNHRLEWHIDAKYPPDPAAPV
jgi:hypothetical protein